MRSIEFTATEKKSMKDCQRQLRLAVTDINSLLAAPSIERLRMLDEIATRAHDLLFELRMKFNWDGSRQGVEAELVEDEPIITPIPKRKALPAPDQTEATR